MFYRTSAVEYLLGGDTEAMPSSNYDNRPPVQACDECRGSYFTKSSQMWSLCPECSHYLYGYPLCEHLFVGSQCSKCGWSGTRSEYILLLIEAQREQQPPA